MYFYFTVHPDVTSHCSFFHSFVPTTQTIKGVSTHTETAVCSCSAARLQTRGRAVTRFRGGDDSPHSFFHTCVTCSMFVTKCQFMERREPWPRGPRGAPCLRSAGGGSLLSHQLINNTNILEQKSYCTFQTLSTSSFLLIHAAKNCCSLFISSKIGAFVVGNKSASLNVSTFPLLDTGTVPTFFTTQTFVLVCDERAFIYAVIGNLSLDSFTSLAALRGNVPALI